LRECLEKDPKLRLRDIGDAQRLLVDEVPLQPAPVGSGLRWKFAAGVMAVVALAALGISFVQFRGQISQTQVLQYTIPPPGKNRISGFAISPDGRYLAIAAQSERGAGAQLWVRALDSLKTQLLPGTEDASFPFWSPDSRYIGFFAQSKLKKIALTGGPTQTLCEAKSARGGTWNRDGVIIFSVFVQLRRVPSAGGIPIPIGNAEDGYKFYPVFLPDGRRFLYTARSRKEAGIYLGSLDSKEERRVALDESNPWYCPAAAGSKSGHLFFVREQTLMAQPVDPISLEARGDVFPLAEQVPGDSASASGYYLLDFRQR
jgi:hypothetical protein